MIVSFIYLLLAFAVIVRLRDKYQGTKWEKPIKVFVIGFVIADWLWTIVFGTLIFWDLPAEFFELGTARMKRYKKTNADDTTYTYLERWRYKFAIRLCDFLNKHDLGHC